MTSVDGHGRHVTDRKSMSSSYRALKLTHNHVNSVSMAAVSSPELNELFHAQIQHALPPNARVTQSQMTHELHAQYVLAAEVVAL